jgi:hypothetical protein
MISLVAGEMLLLVAVSCKLQAPSTAGTGHHINQTASPSTNRSILQRSSLDLIVEIAQLAKKAS